MTASMPDAEIRTLVVERVMKHPPEKIWRALTQGALMEDWLMKNDFQAVEGHRFTLRATPVPGWDGLIDGKVLTVDAQKTLSYTWDSMGLASVVTWTLTPQDGGTLVRMEQAGFRADQQQNYQGAKYGWQKFMDGLDRVSAGA